MPFSCCVQINLYENTNTLWTVEHFMYLSLSRDRSVIWLLYTARKIFRFHFQYTAMDTMTTDMYPDHYFAHFPHSLSQFTVSQHSTWVCLSVPPAACLHLPQVPRYPGYTAHASTQLKRPRSRGRSREWHTLGLCGDKMWHVTTNMLHSLFYCLA